MQVAAAILPQEPQASATKAYDEALRSGAVSSGGAVAVRPEPKWQKQWREMQDKVHSTPSGAHAPWAPCAGFLLCMRPHPSAPHQTASPMK
jgi:hypothetical protein